MPKSIIMLDKISRFVFLGLCFLCFFLNGCTKNSKNTEGVVPDSSRIEYVADIPETVEYDADDVEESDPISYDSETMSQTKVTSIIDVKDHFQHSNCDPSTNKYKDYTVMGGDGYQIILNLSRPDTIVSIVNPSGYYTFQVVNEESTTTQVTVYNTGTPAPDYKARNIKWVITFHNGKTTSLYIKSIPIFSGNIYGSAEYHVNLVRWTADPSKFSLHQHWIPNMPINASYTPTKFDILKYGGTDNPHYGIIANDPVQKTTKINGIVKNVWVFKIKERNANCDYKATTKTFKWYPSLRIPSASPSRDSSSLFYRSI
jgi:hypothetical protein